MKRILWSFTLILAVLMLASCALLAPDAEEPQPVLPTEAALPIAPTIEATAHAQAVQIWLAPPFDPASAAGQLLISRLTAFEAQNPGLRINWRVKPESGAGGILKALEAAVVAAPALVPDLVTLAPDDLRAAAGLTLIQPLPDSLIEPDRDGWYEFALSQSRFDGVSYGMPFAGQVEILAFRTDLYPAAPRSWEALLAEPRTLLFPAADPRARFTIAMYLGAGGTLADESGQPAVDVLILEQILATLATARSSSVIPLAVRQYASPLETWTELKANRSASAMAPMADFLRESDPERLAATALPTEGGKGIALASNWSWTMTASDPARQELILELIAWLSEPGFLGAFTHALGLLPTSQEALAIWPTGGASALANSLVTITRAEPELSLRQAFAPAMQAAVEAVLGAGQDPLSAAQEAAALVDSPLSP